MDVDLVGCWSVVVSFSSSCGGSGVGSAVGSVGCVVLIWLRRFSIRRSISTRFGASGERVRYVVSAVIASSGSSVFSCALAMLMRSRWAVQSRWYASFQCAIALG